MTTYTVTSTAFAPLTIEAEFVDCICVDLEHDADDSNPFVAYDCFDMLTFAVIDGAIDHADCCIVRDIEGNTSITWANCVASDETVISSFSIDVIAN